ncbi:hypothetical protein QBC45DRAFT_317889 [Copromyces sp. CBS 386.78]|nr:hypothetical protein QBC45DRAFT_317889 [Copromyces sp. CBS 386.78]
MSSFFAFATIPFPTRRLPDNEYIGKVARLLRPNLDTLKFVWQAYEHTLLAGLTDGPLGTQPSLRTNEALKRVKDVFLGHKLEANKDFVPVDATVREKVCFNVQNPSHAREVQRYWEAKYKDNIHETWKDLGRWTGCDNEQHGQRGEVSSELHDTEPEIEFPRIRYLILDQETRAALAPSWKEVASTLEDHNQKCLPAFQSFGRDQPAPQMASHSWFADAAHHSGNQSLADA